MQSLCGVRGYAKKNRYKNPRVRFDKGCEGCGYRPHALHPVNALFALIIYFLRTDKKIYVSNLLNLRTKWVRRKNFRQSTLVKSIEAFEKHPCDVYWLT